MEDLIEYKENEGPKRIFSDRFAVNITNNLMHLRFSSGGRVYAFVVPVQLGRTIARAINQQVDEIEKKTGTKIEGGPLSTDPVPSPISAESISSDDK